MPSINKEELKNASFHAVVAAATTKGSELTTEETVDVVIDTLIKLTEDEAPVPALTAYKLGDTVEIFNDSDGKWYAGHITEAATDGLNTVHVHTDRGPKTIGNRNRIRKA